MNEARPFASLSSGLLARKGAAKPAMRPQAYSNFDDLGWNDMGEAPDEVAAPEHVPSSIAALTPAPRPTREEPSVVAQQRAILESFEGEEDGDVAEAPVPTSAEAAKVVPLQQPRVGAAGRKAAFTLRLDADRHLRLRLACAVTGRSAQQIVTGALDELLATIPEIEALAERVPAKAGAAGAKRN
jgi:hypothetical protein